MCVDLLTGPRVTGLLPARKADAIRIHTCLVRTKVHKAEFYAITWVKENLETPRFSCLKKHAERAVKAPYLLGALNPALDGEILKFFKYLLHVNNFIILSFPYSLFFFRHSHSQESQPLPAHPSFSTSLPTNPSPTYPHHHPLFLLPFPSLVKTYEAYQQSDLDCAKFDIGDAAVAAHGNVIIITIIWYWYWTSKPSAVANWKENCLNSRELKTTTKQ